MELVAQRIGSPVPFEIGPDQRVSFTMLSVDTVEDGQQQVREALEFAGRELALDWTEFFQFAVVPGH